MAKAIYLLAWSCATKRWVFAGVLRFTIDLVQLAVVDAFNKFRRLVGLHCTSTTRCTTRWSGPSTPPSTLCCSGLGSSGSGLSSRVPSSELEHSESRAADCRVDANASHGSSASSADAPAAAEERLERGMMVGRGQLLRSHGHSHDMSSREPKAALHAALLGFSNAPAAASTAWTSEVCRSR
uniref:Uncharacterized protein n=1 Tax=Haptolina brevifila TaxID=156173 RepID=A0A7S2GLM3_9EUKA|mmetsp:Transcript_41070/g.82323  ORF Transcript_41070/g.82323 Transcript_41070/m.82323 type:complete len:182 (+) Transcript_41070:42-587(+)